MTVRRIVAGVVLTAVAVLVPVATAAPASAACGVTPGFCPNPPDTSNPDTGDITRESYPAWHTEADWS
jgi:hypothetical protein